MVFLQIVLFQHACDYHNTQIQISWICKKFYIFFIFVINFMNHSHQFNYLLIRSRYIPDPHCHMIQKAKSGSVVSNKNLDSLVNSLIQKGSLLVNSVTKKQNKTNCYHSENTILTPSASLLVIGVTAVTFLLSICEGPLSAAP